MLDFDDLTSSEHTSQQRKRAKLKMSWMILMDLKWTIGPAMVRS